MNGLEELVAYKTARGLRIFISGVVKEFPSEEKYRLTDQIIRAARSVTANIAEGYGRFHYQETIQFCRHARGSIYELVDHFNCALDENLINKTTLAEARKQLHGCLKILNGYIKWLKDQKESNKK